MTIPDVTVVTVTYNAADLVLNCLASLAAQQLGGLSMQVVVVDNGSHDGTADLVERTHPEVVVVRARRNLGFAAGNNLALRHVRSRYVLLLNNDATAAPTLVRSMAARLEVADEGLAALAATVLLAERFRAAGPADDRAVAGPDGRWVPDPGGDVRLVNSTGNEVRVDGYGVDRGWLGDARRHHPPASVFGFSGAAAMLRTSALRDVGLFDERLFMYYEDTDLSWRLRRAGRRIEHCPEAVVEHVHSASSHEGSDFFHFHDDRNRLAVLTKNASRELVLRAVARFVLTIGSVALRRREPWSRTRVRLRALTSYASLLPHLLRERRRVERTAVVARSQIERLLVDGPTVGPFRAPAVRAARPSG